MDTVAILGAGAWGTALAVHLAQTRSAPSIRLWARDPAQVRALTMTRENARYLPGIALDSAVTVSADLREVLAGASLLLVATPIGALIEIVTAAIGDETKRKEIVVALNDIRYSGYLKDQHTLARKRGRYEPENDRPPHHHFRLTPPIAVRASAEYPSTS